MSGMGLSVRVGIKEDKILEALARLVLDPDDTHDVLDSIGFALSESTRLRFIDQESPDGVPWVPSLRAIAQNGETLRDTGVLMNSITHLVQGDTVEIGTNVPYAVPLQEGALIRAKNGPYLTFRTPLGWAKKASVTLPSRPYIGISDEDATEVIDIINAFLATRGKR